MKKQTVKTEGGVHWGWWLFWLLIFWPALIITAVIHFNNRHVVIVEEDE